MRFDLITLFPEAYRPVGVIHRGVERGLLEVYHHDLRPFGVSDYRQVDDAPYGGGAGMILRADVLESCLKTIPRIGKNLVVLPSARGVQYHATITEKFREYDQLIFVCGRYEGIDQRFIDAHVDLELSLGPYVISGGELCAEIVVDSVARLIPGVLGNQESLAEESNNLGSPEYPQYTRPAELNGLLVPQVLLGGHHAEIAKWRKSQGLLYSPKTPDGWDVNFKVPQW